MASLYPGVSRTLCSGGWFLHHQGKGSRELWRHQTDPEGDQISVPFNIKKTPTAESIMKAAGLPKDSFLASKKALKKRKRGSGSR